MASRRLRIAVLTVLTVLTVLGAVQARPSEEGAAAAAAAVETTTLSEMAAGLAECASLPDSLGTPQQVAGDWCALENIEVTQNATIPRKSCGRLTLAPGGNSHQLQINITSLQNGQITNIWSAIYSKVMDGSWLGTMNGLTSNYFIGLSNDGKYLQMCEAITEGDAARIGFYNTTAARCLRPGEEALVATGERPNVMRCYLPEIA